MASPATSPCWWEAIRHIIKKLRNADAFQAQSVTWVSLCLSRRSASAGLVSPGYARLGGGWGGGGGICTFIDCSAMAKKRKHDEKDDGKCLTGHGMHMHALGSKLSHVPVRQAHPTMDGTKAESIPRIRSRRRRCMQQHLPPPPPSPAGGSLSPAL